MPDVDQFCAPPPPVAQPAVEPNAPNALGNKALVMNPIPALTGK